MVRRRIHRIRRKQAQAPRRCRPETHQVQKTGEIIRNPLESHVEIFENADGSSQLAVRFDNNTVWLNLNQMATLFGRDKSVISRHIKSIYASDELDREATVAEIATVANESGRRVSRNIEFFN